MASKTPTAEFGSPSAATTAARAAIERMELLILLCVSGFSNVRLSIWKIEGKIVEANRISKEHMKVSWCCGYSFSYITPRTRYNCQVNGGRIMETEEWVNKKNNNNLYLIVIIIVATYIHTYIRWTIANVRGKWACKITGGIAVNKKKKRNSPEVHNINCVNWLQTNVVTTWITGGGISYLIGYCQVTKQVRVNFQEKKRGEKISFLALRVRSVTQWPGWFNDPFIRASVLYTKSSNFRYAEIFRTLTHLTTHSKRARLRYFSLDPAKDSSSFWSIIWGRSRCVVWATGFSIG